LLHRCRLACLAGGMLLGIVAAWSPGAAADGNFVVTPPPQTGAYLAEFVEDRGHVSVINFSGNYDAHLSGGSLNAEARAVVAKEFYRNHADEYDFLVVFSAFEFDSGEAVAFHIGVQNGVEGIGVPIFDNSAEFGSDGKLQGYIDMAALSRYEVDPLNPEFEFLLNVLSHEILHQWAAKVRFINDEGNPDEGLLGKDGSHWSYLLDSNASVEYGAKWRDNGDGSFTATAVRKFFSPLDLYLMGLYRADEVPPFTLIENPDIDKTRLPEENVTIEGVPRLVRIEDVIAAEGPRVPAAGEAQTEFRIGFVLLKGATQKIPNHYYVALDSIRQAYGQRFAIATGGRALAHVYPQAIYTYASGAPTEVGGEGADPRPGPSLADGLAWLRAEQHEDGYWNDKESTRLRDTTYALQTLLSFDTEFSNPLPAIEWINAQQAGNADYLARQLAMFGNNPQRGTLDQLLVLQNSDGGWGLAGGYDSDPLDTALAILALRKASASQATIGRAIQFLLHNQNADGGWGNAVETESRTGITATVLMALESADVNPGAVDDALALLKSRQNGDGGFGDSPSTVYDTSLALQVFMAFDRVEQIEAEAAATYLLGLQLDDGSWGGSTYATALAITALKRFNFANWQITPQLTIEPASPRDGDRVRLVIAITNDSNLFTPESSLVIYDGNPREGGVRVGNAIAIPVLAPGATVTLTQYWDSLDRAGEHELYAVADPDGLFTELSESDNQGSVSVSVAAAPDGIDLAVIEPDLAVMPARPNSLPSTMGIVAKIRNSGLTDAAQVRVVLQKESATITAGIVDEVVVNVPNRSSVVVNFTDLLGEPGETGYTVVIDPDDSIAEVSETNNSAALSVSTDASVDFEISAGDISSDVNPAIFGEPINFSVRIRNRGTRDTPTTQVRYVVSNGVEGRDLASNNLQLGPGETVEQSINWQVDLSGTLQFTAEVDFATLVTELDETNNLASLSLPIESRNGANLSVGYGDLGFSPEVAEEGGSVNLAAAILNNGNLSAGAFEVAFYVGDPDAGGTLIGTPQSVAGLAAGERAYVSLDWQPVPSAGDKLIYVVADVNDTIAEPRDDDNRAFNVLTVSSLPDLAVSSSDIVIDPKFPSAGADVTLSVVVANLGDQSASNILVRLYEGDSSASGRLAGEQTIESLGKEETGALEFALTLDADIVSSSFVVEVDPLGEVLERNRENNRALREVTLQRGDIFATNLYLSPNADGIQDSTEIVFILQEPTDVVLQVVDARDRVLREYSEDLTGIVQGSVLWDGLDGRGRLVPDGDYRLRLVRVGGSDLAEVLVQVDTNRSSLLLANNSEFEYFNNLTCELDRVYAINLLESEAELVIEAGDNDIFSLNSNGTEARAIIPSDWFGDTEPYYTQTSKDGSVVAFTRYDPATYSDISPVWASDGDGENLREVHPAVEDGWVMRDDGTAIYVRQNESRVFSVDMQTGAEKLLYTGEYDIEIESFSFKPQPNGGKLLVLDNYYDDSGPAVVLIDADDDSFAPLFLAPNWRNYNNPPGYEWSPDGSKIAVTSHADGMIYVFDSKGRPLGVFDSPAGPSNAKLGEPAWSSTGAEVAVSIVSADNDEQGEQVSGIYVLNLDDSSIRKVANLEAGASDEELSSYHVSTWDGSDWVERGVLHYRRFYREQQMDLSAWLPDIDGEYKLRIRQTGKEAAHVESVALLHARRRAIPSSVVKLDDSLYASLVDRWTDTPRGEDALASVSHNDYEVLDLFEAQMQVEWKNLARGGQVILALNAREEALSKLNTLPFTYAGAGEGGYSYQLAANAPINVDGNLGADDGLDAPLFQHFSRPGTGHPSATVSGYVGSDREFLYGALDFTVDNTLDGDLDWAAMRVMTASGWKEFRVTVQDDRYGLVNFTRTPAVPFPHKYYEFRIPLAELEREPGDSIMVSFQGYGTAALVLDENYSLPRDGRLLWPPGDQNLFYDAYGEGKWSVNLNDSNRIREVFSAWPGGSGDVIDPFFTDSGRKLLFLSNRATNDPASICYDQGTDLWSYESLLNLVVDLRATRSNSAGGIILAGTVSDLNFQRYTLEYASQHSPDLWTPIFTGSAVQVVDARLTTWAPPAVGKYLVRLTAYDRAGNSRSVTQRVSWGLNSAITNLSLTPEFISPNGDGVQDEATLHYRVLEPVHLDFSVYNEQGDVVRSFTRDHGLIGTEHDLVWDGRNKQGLPVADGRYRIAVLGFEFFVNVDSTAPQIQSLEIRTARQQVISNLKARVVSDPGLSWSTLEASQYSIEIETGDGATPDSWRPFAQPLVRDNDPQSIDTDEDELGLTLGQYVDRAFRMRVSDVAGNVTTLSVPPGAQELILTGLVLEESDQLTETSYQVDETLAAPIALAFIEYRDLGSSNDWREVPIDAASLAEQRFSFSWLPPEADFGKRFSMRIRAVDSNAQVFYSNEKQLYYAGLAVKRLNRFASKLTESASFNGLDAEGRLSLEMSPASNKQYILESLRIELTSTTDPRYAAPVELLRIDADIELQPGQAWSIPYQALNLSGCQKYATRAHYAIRVTDTSGSTPQIKYFTDQLTSRNSEDEQAEEEMPCLSVSTGVTYAPAQNCSVQTDHNVEIALVPVSGNEFGLKLLTLYTENAAGDRDVFYNVNKPISGQTYRYQLNGANRPEGVLEYFVELINDANQVHTESVKMLIDRTQPAAALTYPLEGQQVCALPRQKPSGEFENLVDINVDVNDPIGDLSGDDPLEPFSDELRVQIQRAPDSSAKGTGLLRYLDGKSESVGQHSVNGKIAELVNANGDHQLLLTATDLAGNQQCLLRSFSVDGIVERETLRTDYTLFSPNDDGVLDSLDVEVGVDEAVSLDISVYAAILGANGKVVKTGAELRRLADQRQLLPGTEILGWDGRDSGGQVVADGLYLLEFDYRDACGNRSQQQFVATVDRTPPTASIDYPRAGDPLTSILQLLATVDDLHLRNFQLQLGQGSDPDAWIDLAAGTRSIDAEVVAIWNTLDLVGPYTLRLVVTDKAGNEREVRSQLELLERSSLIDYFEALPLMISPNQDNRREAANIRLGLVSASLLTLDILDENDVAVRSLALDRAFAAGAVNLSWDGRNDAGEVVADGTYRVALGVALAENPLVREEASLTLVVDASAPEIALTGPGSFANGTDNIIGSISDAHLLGYDIALTSTPAAPEWSSLASGNRNQAQQLLAGLGGLEEGDYALRVSATDEGEILSELIIPFSVDNTPPVVDILTPEAASFIGAGSASADISIDVVEDNLETYTLRIGEGESPDTWIELASGSELPPADPLLVLDASAYADGPHSLLLSASDAAGNQASIRRTVQIDNSPPLAEILSPLADGYVTGPVAISGNASDANLLSYRLDIAPGTLADASQWSPIGAGAAAVNNATLLDWQSLPSDGAYVLRLEVLDRAENLGSASVAFSVDTTPPAAPAGLSGVIEAAIPSLDWQAGAEDDIAGYRVYRDGVQVSTGLVTSTSFRDESLADGRYRYSVRAEDNAGWLSEASAEFELLLDTTPPVTRIFTPRDNSVVSGVIQLQGTANSADDFREYRVYLRPDGATEWQLRERSPVPVVAGLLLELDTTEFSEGASFGLKLEAEDINGNVGEAVINLRVDNVAPQAPTGLVAVASDNDVNLVWNPNVEDDLLGYLLFRGDRIANAEGVVIGDLKPYALLTTSYADLALPDGYYAYTVAAIDLAGNISEASLASELLIDTRPPAAVIATPGDGARFDSTQYVNAVSEATDIARVQFQYKAAAASVWIDLGPADESEPYSASLDPLALNLAQGVYQLRAIATDVGARIDPAPAAIVVYYTDVTRPAAVLGLAALAYGPDVTLTWEASTESDLAGYHVERIDASGEVTRLTDSLLTATTLVDPVGDDGIYDYRVFAQDSNDNLGDPSNTATARVHTPLLQQPYTPLAEPGPIELVGRGVALASVSGTLDNADGEQALPEAAADSDGVFRLPDLTLALGANRFSLRLTDSFGHVSKEASVSVTYGLPPAPPTGLAADLAGYDVTLNWNDNSEADLLGYRIFRDGEDLLGEYRAFFVDAEASDSQSSAFRSIDSSRSSYWWLYTSSGLASNPALLTLTLDQAQLLAEVEVEWYRSYYRVLDYDIQALSDGVWVTLKRVRDSVGAVQTIELDQPYYSDQIRLRLLRAYALEDDYYLPVRLADVRLKAHEVLPTPGYQDTAIDGEFDYQVSAVNTLGFEGARSEALTVGVGDVTAPDAVILSATVDGSDVTLNWAASASSDVSRYELFRDGALLAELGVNDLSYVDTALANGGYSYVVYAIDSLDLRSMASNQVDVTVAVGPLAAPELLSVTPVVDGASLDLAWQGPPAGLPSRYRVLRALESGGPYTAIADVDASAWRDLDLVNGATYYYRIAALDEAGNAGDLSNELNGVPLDEIEPVTVLLSPGADGVPHLVNDPVVDIFGQSEPRATIRLLHDLIPAADTVSSGLADITAYPVDASRLEGSLSPDGRTLLQVLSANTQFTDLADGSISPFVFTVNNDHFAWAGDGSGVTYSRPVYYQGAIRDTVYFRSADGYVRTWTNPYYAGEDFDYPVTSSHASRFAAIGRPGSGVFGLWTKSVSSSDWTLLKAGDSIVGGSLRWSPDDRYLAYRVTDVLEPRHRLEIVDLDNGNIIVVDDSADTLSNLSWSADSGSLLYSRVEGNASNIWRYDIASGLGAALTSGNDNDFSDPHEFIGPTKLLAVGDGTDLVLIDLDRQIVVTQFESASIKRGSLHKAQTGDFAFIDASRAELLRFTPAGRFHFAEVPLRIGDNRFAAAASDDSDQSAPSLNTIVVTYDVGDKPDLALAADAITLVPAIMQAGVRATLQVEVSNRGGAAADNATLTLVATDSAGFSQVLLGKAPLGYLAPGASISLTAGWTPGFAGAYRLLAVVDADGRIDEGDESNNSLTQSVPVLATADPLLNLSTDQAFYGAGDVVSASLELFNGGNAFSGFVEVIIEDALGYSVDRIVAERPVEMAYGDRERSQFSWNSGAIFAGDYRVHAYLLNDQHEVVADQIASFAIGATQGFNSAVISDRDRYTGNSDVRVSASLSFAAGNAVFSGAVAQLQIVDADAVIVAARDFELGSMLPGDTQTFSLEWNTALSGPGDYSVRFDVTRDQQRITEAYAGFSVVAGESAVEASLALDDDAPAVAAPQAARFELTNTNNLALTQLPVRLRLIDPGAQVILQEKTFSFDIAPGAAVAGSAVLDTAELALKTYTVLLEASIESASGSVWVSLANADFVTRDRSAPGLTLQRPAANGYVRGDTEVIVSAVDDLSFIDRVELSVDGGGWQAMALADAGRGEYKLALPGLDEGAHQVEARAFDAWDNRAQSAPRGFVVDNTAPVIEVGGVVDAGIYNAAVAPTVAVGETYPDRVYITRGGLPFVSGDALAQDGTYQLQIYAVDLAGNESQLVVSFDIDQLAPLVEISGVVDGATYAGEVTPVIAISDANLLNQLVLLNGVPYVSATPIVDEGEYLLEAVGTDTAGNVTRAEYRFRIDRSAPAITLGGVADQAYYNTEVAAVIDIDDAGPFDATITLNAVPYSSGEPITAPGIYQLAVNAVDVAGNAASLAIAFVIDTTAPVISIGGVAENGFYPVAVAEISVSESNPQSLSITLDAAAYVPQTPIHEEGEHLLRVVAIDLAGNESSRELLFTVDSTAPGVSVDTPLHGETLYTRNTDVIGQTEAFARVDLAVGEARISTQADAGGRFEFNGVILEQGPNTLLLSAVDRALNEGPVTGISVQVVTGNVPGEYSAPGGVLIFAPLKYDHCDKSGKSGKSRKSKKYGKSACRAHEPGEMFDHEGEPALAVIETALVAAQRDYLLVHSEDGFLEAMRSQRFGTLMLLDWHKDYCGKYDPGCDSKDYKHLELKLDKDSLNEIRALVASGTGLILFKTRPDQDKHWEDLNGVRVNGSLKDVTGVKLLTNPATTVAQFDYAGRAVRLEAEGAAVIARSQPGGEGMMTLNDYGDGRVAVLGYNPAADPDSARAATLIGDVLDHVAPTTSRLFVNGVAEVAWMVEDVEEGTPIDLQVDLAMPLIFLHAGEAVLNETLDSATWQRDFALDDNRYFGLVRLPPFAAIYGIEARLSSNQNGSPVVLNTSLLELAVENDFAMARERLVAAVMALETEKQGKSSKSQKNGIEKILERLDKAFEHDPATASSEDLEEAIAALVDAVYQLGKKSLDTEAVTREVGEVIRFYQSAWYQQVIDEGPGYAD